MIPTRPASWLALSFAAATCVATFSQCGPADGPRPSSEGAGAPARAASRPAAPDPGARSPNLQEPKNQEPKNQVPKPDARPVEAPPADAVRLLISGAMLGRLEPCGCASGQLGGLARRMQHVGEQRTYDLLLEGGDLVGGDTELDVMKLMAAATVLFRMERPYDVLGVGLRDLALPRDEWSAFLAGVPVVATNLSSAAPDWPGLPFVDKDVRGLRVRTASLLLPELPEAATAGGALERTDPVAAWRDAFAGVEPEVLRIAMLYGPEQDVRATLPRLEPRPDLAIAVDGGYVEPTAAPTIVADVPLVFTGIRGRVLLDARLWRSGDRSRVACELVPLAGSRTVPGGGGDPQVHDVLLEHRRNVKEFGVLASMAERTPTPSGAAYVGTETCRSCHPSSYDAWAKTKHAGAWQTLVDAENDPKRYGWPVTAYPDCVGCHVVGYGHETGFVGPDTTPHLRDVGCERCHGPGSEHVAAAGTAPLGILGGALPSVMCTECHDFEQSPDFVYGDRWAAIAHGLEPHQQAVRDARKQGAKDGK